MENYGFYGFTLLCRTPTSCLRWEHVKLVFICYILYVKVFKQWYCKYSALYLLLSQCPGIDQSDLTV